MQDWITFNYAEVGRRLPGSILSCVGEAFRASLRDHPEIVLIQSDLNHATVAGTYLAASTFYVALTGNPVPPASEVPSEVSPQDAELLRQEALVGSNCADVHPKADVVMLDCAFAGNGNYGCTCASIGACPFDFGVAGTSLPDVFLVDNLGLGTAGITDGLTLAPPFAWTSGAYPGGSGTVSSAGIQYDFCSTSLPAGAICALSVSYDGTTEGNGTLTLNLTDAYSASVAGKLHGSPTTRALLTVSEDSGFFGCSDTNCNGPVGLFAGLGTSVPISFVVSNRGGAPTTSLGVGTPPSPPFYWGPSGTSGTFPGGSGSGVVGGVTYDYCATQTLGAGQQCMVTVSLLAVTGDAPPFTGAVNLAYSDAQGPVLPNANRDLKGGWPMPP
jgi:hypothetical protein